MRLDNKLFDKILDQAKDSPRKRMHYDMRTQAMEITSNVNSEPWKDMSQRMLNVLLPETKPPIINIVRQPKQLLYVVGP
jgi:hypothetical protein